MHIKDTYYSNDGEWIGDYFLHTGLTANREDNPFQNWSVIQILYCNGDFHCGNGEFAYTAQDGSRRVMPFHGYSNALSVIEQAKQLLPEPEILLIAGSSAGGFGAAQLAEDVIGEFPGCDNITLCVDSSLIFSDRWGKITKDVWHAPEHICGRIKGENIVLDNLAELHEAKKDVKILFISSARDALLTVAQNAIDGKGQTFSLADGARYQNSLKRMCEELTKTVPTSGLYIFKGPMDAPGYDDAELTLHCILNNPFLFDHKEDGKSATRMASFTTTA